jgi:hypothetical protein
MILALAAAALLVGCPPKPAEKGAKPKAGETPRLTGLKVTPVPAAGEAVCIEAEKFKITDATVKDYPKASGGKAVLMDKDTSKIETTVELPAGKYDVVLTAIAPDEDRDAVDVSVDGVDPKSGVRPARERVFFDKEYNTFVPGSVKVEVTLPHKAQVKLTVAVDNEKDMAIDKVEFVPSK